MVFLLTFQEVVSQNCVVIFSKTTCPYCRMAKNVFNEIGATYKVIELDEHDDGRRLQETLARMTGARTVRAACCFLQRSFNNNKYLKMNRYNGNTKDYLLILHFARSGSEGLHKWKLHRRRIRYQRAPPAREAAAVDRTVRPLL